MRAFPALVCQLIERFDAWIVGSACDTLNPKDYDIVVPWKYWDAAALLIPKDATVNTFGGWKCQSEGKEVDVWPGDLGMLFLSTAAKHAWQPKYGIRLKREGEK